MSDANPYQSPEDAGQKSISVQRAAPTGWNYVQLGYAFFISFLLQAMFLPCLCYLGTAKGRIAAIFDILVVIRTAIARITNERGRGWLFYVILLYTSVLWIEGLVWLFLGGH